MSPEQEVRQAAEQLVASFIRNDLDAYFAAFAPDASFVFPTTARVLPSVADYRDEWAQWVRDDGFRILDCSTSDVDVRLHGDTAVLTHRVSTTVQAAGETTVLRERETIVFRRQEDGRWLAVHEHLSTAPDQD